MLSFRLVLICASFLALTAAVARSGEDVVHYVHPGNDRLVSISGQVVDYTASYLQLRSASGRVTEIPSPRVQRIDSQWTPPHVAADRLVTEGKFQEAIPQYVAAIRQETRVWVRYRILSQMVWCYRSLQQFDRAGDAFAQLIANQPETPYFDAIPLVWQPYPPSLGLEQRARSWLDSQVAPAIRLMGASFLLSGRNRLMAQHALQDLQTVGDQNVAVLAGCQLWRTRVATATADDLRQWQSTLEQIPPPLRAGPYFVLGKALVQQNQLELAALALLRVPILYPRHRMLAAESLVSAGDLLERLDRSRPARNVYQEVADQYADTVSADLARQRLHRLSADGSR